MAFLPIVGRELRVAARRRSVYWGRLLMAVVAFVIWAFLLFLTFAAPPQASALLIFQGLAGLSLVYCLLYGRQTTADCLSSEKREGTLGLLFLTDLKGYDIVLGKLAATSLTGFYGMLAIFPILAIPLMMGGVTNGEFWRTVLVLVNTFLFSLAVGMLVSAMSRDAHRAMGANLVLLLAIVGLPPAIAGLRFAAQPSLPVLTELFLSCPVFSFYAGGDVRYAKNPSQFWLSVGVIHVLTWLLLFLASRIIPHAWRDQPRGGKLTETTAAPKIEASRSHNTESELRFRQAALDVNPFYWLATRPERKANRVWIFLLCAAVWWLLGWAASQRYWLDASVFVLTALLLNTTLKCWIAIEAGRQLAEDHKAGVLELLLSTPLSAAGIIRGQWQAVLRQFLAPLAAVIGVELLFLWYLQKHDAETILVWLAGIVLLVADSVALFWVAMWRALNSKGPPQATFGALMRVLALPLILMAIISGIVNTWASFGGTLGTPEWPFYLALWFGLGLMADLAFGGAAWWGLRHRFRELALARYSQARVARTAWRLPRLTSKPSTPKEALLSEPAHSRRPRRKLAYALAAGVVVLGFIGWRLLRASPALLPPPVTVSLNQSNGPVRVFSGGTGVFIVLPDGSLWKWALATGGWGTPPMPERVGTNQSWVKVVGTGTRSAGIQSDGTLWHSIGSAEMTQLPYNDWVDVAVSGSYGIGLRRDGTLWEWGNRLPGNAPITNPQAETTAGRFGTNDHWAEIASMWTSTLALRKDGTLWAWGEIYPVVGTGTIPMVTSLPAETRLCRETNWTGFITGFPVMIHNSRGEVWALSSNPPDPDGPASSGCYLVAEGVKPGRFTAAYSDPPKLYQVRDDGTLWAQPFTFNRGATFSTNAWRRIGLRSDWVRLYGAGATAFGLTADGTLWMWGFDPTRPGPPSLLSVFARLQAQITARLSGRMVNFGAGRRPYIQKEPRALLRIGAPQ